ncbi:CD82 antigen-like isoform X2 [Nerophis ophidion]|uniref:CD82 antigen-like isoform X2 n=1 Tax=Nerophis ophidion TaxID=159077 RepID=UPI002ADFD634|nr:CD82 antigen-like isoform X2 [Nerophis ophidion]
MEARRRGVRWREEACRTRSRTVATISAQHTAVRNHVICSSSINRGKEEQTGESRRRNPLEETDHDQQTSDQTERRCNPATDANPGHRKVLRRRKQETPALCKVPRQPDNSIAVKAACYILIGVGAFSMVIGFLGCLGAICESQCLLGLYFACLLLILIAEIVAGSLVYFYKGVVNEKLSKIVSNVLDNYPENNSTAKQPLDFIQRNMECCGWNGPMDWNGNMVIINSSQLLFPCSCQNVSIATGNVSKNGFCEAQTPDWPVYDTLMGMILAIRLCRNIHLEDYTKVPKLYSSSD